MTTGKAGDATRADLAAIGDEAADQGQILVVDLLDRKLRVLAGAVLVERAAAAATRRCGGGHQRAPRELSVERFTAAGDCRERRESARSAGWRPMTIDDLSEPSSRGWLSGLTSSTAKPAER